VSVPQPGYDEVPAGEGVTGAGAADGAGRAVSIDGECGREAAHLPHDHAGWVVVWLAPAEQFHAYKRLPGARRDTALAAATASDLAAQIERAEQPARLAAARRGQR
jgi:hypothetical protein